MDEEKPRLNRFGEPDKRSGNGGLRPGAGIKKGTELPTKRTYPKNELIQKVVQGVITGKISPETRALPLTEADKRVLERISSLSVEQFNEYIAQDLREISALSAQCIKEALVSRQFKPGELGFIHSVAHDKRLSLDGSRALSASSVNLTVNNFGPTSKDTLLCDLDGLTHTKNVTPAQ